MQGWYLNQFAYLRDVGLGVKYDRYGSLTAAMFRILKPGGWVQLTNINMPVCEDGSLPLDSPYSQVWFQ